MIRIKVAILDADETYTGRLTNAFNTYYQDKLEVYSFTDKDIAMQFLSSNRIDVFLVDESIDIEILEIPSNCAFAYLTAINSADTVNGEKGIGKFQKVDLIYKEILSLFSEVSSYSINTSGSTEGKNIVSFMSFAGGTGASTVAAAYAMRLARRGRKPIYLNLERFGGADSFFEGEGNMSMSDVIYALKSKKANLGLKIQSVVKKTSDGVYFIDTANLVLDVLELKKEDIITLINELNAIDDYDEIIVDYNFTFADVDLEIMKMSDAVIAITDGSSVGNNKTFRCLSVLQLLEQQRDEKLLQKIKLFYNKFSSVNGKKLTNINVDVIGGAPFYNGLTKQIVASLSTGNELDKI